jgi:hypothetical protein
MLIGRKPMSMHKTSLPLFSAVVFGAMVASGANAQTEGDPVLDYAAKFTCGQVAPSDAASGGDADVVVGVYATSINIHNPQRFAKISFTKKVVLAKAEGQPRATPVEEQDTLGPDEAEFVDCPLIYNLLGFGETRFHIEGFVVIEVPRTRVTVETGRGSALVLLPLDVVGKYSARPSTGEVSTLDLVVYNPTETTH